MYHIIPSGILIEYLAHSEERLGQLAFAQSCRCARYATGGVVSIMIDHSSSCARHYSLLLRQHRLESAVTAIK